MSGAGEAQGRKAAAVNNVSPTRSASAIARSLKEGRNNQAMMIFKKAIPRRTFIRGAGVTLALPLLDGMIPALAAAEKPVKRFSIVYVPNGRIMEKWTPATDGTDFELPFLLEPFAPFRDRLLVVTGLALNVAKHAPGEEVGVHERPCGAYLTGVHPKWTDGADIRNAGVALTSIRCVGEAQRRRYRWKTIRAGHLNACSATLGARTPQNGESFSGGTTASWIR